MAYPAPATVEAADGGGAGRYNSSEELEGQEPDGVRFDRERARRLWEAVSGAQPVGREEGESGALEAGSPSPACAARGELRKRLRSHPPGPPPCVLRSGTPRLVLPIQARAPQESGPQRAEGDHGRSRSGPELFPSSFISHHSAVFP